MSDQVPAPQAGIPQLELGTFHNQIFWLVLFLLILYLFISRVALPRIEQIHQNRRDKIEIDLEEAKRATEETESINRQAEKILETANQSAEAIAAETRDKIRVQQDKEMETVVRKVSELTSESEERISEIRDQAPRQIQSMVEQMLPEIMNFALPQQRNSLTGRLEEGG